MSNVAEIVVLQEIEKKIHIYIYIYHKVMEDCYAFGKLARTKPDL
jgi:hypothetical protein